MRKFNLTLVVLTVLFLGLQSCTSDEMLETAFTDISTSQLKSMIIAPELNNPQLKYNWENLEQVYLNSKVPVYVPWYNTNNQPHQINIPDDIRYDIKKADGWQLWYHSMHDKAIGKGNFILFYNKYTGIMKVFYYHLDGQSNNNCIWALSSDRNTSVFTSNTIYNTPIDGGDVNKYMTTSNITREAITNFGQLAQEWNCFTFEFQYGRSNTNPIVSITQMNSHASTLHGTGTYSGEVQYEVEKNNNFLSSFMKGLKSVFGGLDSKFPNSIWDDLEKGASVAGTITGSSIFNKTKKEIKRLPSKGNFELTAQMITNEGGLASSCFGIDVKSYNDNKDVGLWNLARTPVLEYDVNPVLFTELVEIVPWNPGYPQSRTIKTNTKLQTTIKDLEVVVNPAVKDKLRRSPIVTVSYCMDHKNVSYYQGMFDQRNLITPYTIPNITGGTKPVQNLSISYTDLLMQHEYRIPQNYNYDASTVEVGIMPITLSKDDVFINVNVEFEFVMDDGRIQKYVSSRNFKVTPKPIDSHPSEKAAKALREAGLSHYRYEIIKL